MNEIQSPVTAALSAKSRRFTDDFKRDAVSLVTEEQYKFKAAAQAVSMSEKSLRDWHKKFAPHRCRVVMAQPSPSYKPRINASEKSSNEQRWNEKY